MDNAWDIETSTEAELTNGYPFLSWQLGSSPAWYINYPPTIENFSETGTTKASTDISADVYDNDGDNILWVAFVDNSDDSIIENITIEYSEPHHYTILWDNLSMGENYAWYVVTEDSKGAVSKSEVQTFYVSINYSPIIENFSETDITKTSADISADVYDNDGDDISWMAIINNSNGTIIENKNNGPYTSPSSVSTTLIGLSSGTTYNYYIMTSDNNGAVNCSTVQSFTTSKDKSPPPQPPILKIETEVVGNEFRGWYKEVELETEVTATAGFKKMILNLASRKIIERHSPKKSVNLEEGIHSVLIKAFDKKDRSTSKTMNNIKVDSSEPKIENITIN